MKVQQSTSRVLILKILFLTISALLPLETYGERVCQCYDVKPAFDKVVQFGSKPADYPEDTIQDYIDGHRFAVRQMYGFYNPVTVSATATEHSKTELNSRTEHSKTSFTTIVTSSGSSSSSSGSSGSSSSSSSSSGSSRGIKGSFSQSVRAERSTDQNQDYNWLSEFFGPQNPIGDARTHTKTLQYAFSSVSGGANTAGVFNMSSEDFTTTFRGSGANSSQSHIHGRSGYLKHHAPLLDHLWSQDDEGDGNQLRNSNSLAGSHHSHPSSFSSDNSFVQFNQQSNATGLLQRHKRSTLNFTQPPPTAETFDDCCVATKLKHKVYILQNSLNETRFVVNTDQFEQHIHVALCGPSQPKAGCNSSCRCQQQYSMQRLMVYDPTNKCNGLFMDWFEIESHCAYQCPTK